MPILLVSHVESIVFTTEMLSIDVTRPANENITDEEVLFQLLIL